MREREQWRREKEQNLREKREQEREKEIDGTTMHILTDILQVANIGRDLLGVLFTFTICSAIHFKVVFILNWQLFSFPNFAYP